MRRSIRLAFILAAWLIPLTGVQAQYYYDIEPKNLPSDQAYRKQLVEFDNVYQYVAGWSPEWKAKVPKEQVVSLLKSLLKMTKDEIAKEKNPKIDRLLFRALLEMSLYNSHAGEYHDIAVKDLQAIKQQYPQDYRAYWMLANHYGFADEIFLAMKEYDTLFSTVLQGKGSKMVLADYLAANFSTYMFARCKAMIEDIAKQNNITNIANTFWMYNSLVAQLQPAPVKSFIPKEMCFLPQRRETEVGFLSRVLGIWIPLKSTWTTEALGVTTAGLGSFTIRIPQKVAKGGMITTSISIITQAFPDQGFDEFIDKVMKLPARKKKVSDVSLRWPALVYEHWDDASFKPYGGGHGLAVFIKRSTPTIKGIGIEAPALLPSKDQDSKVNYVVLGDGYTRFDGEIYYAFFLDSSDQAFTEAKKEFIEFLNRVLLD